MTTVEATPSLSLSGRTLAPPLVLLHFILLISACLEIGDFHSRFITIAWRRCFVLCSMIWLCSKSRSLITVEVSCYCSGFSVEWYFIFIFDIDCANFLGKIYARKPSSDSESSSLATTPSEKLGGHQSDDSSSAVTGHVEPLETVSQDTTTQVCTYMLIVTMLFHLHAHDGIYFSLLLFSIVF